MSSHQDTSVDTSAAADVEAFIDALLRIKRPPEDARTVDAEVVPLLVDTPGAWPDGAQVMVHVRKRGLGPHALLVHGWQGRTSDMEKIGDALVASGFTVWAPHLPGHGTSGGERLSIPLAARVLRAVEGVTGPLALAVGHSIGGACIVQALEEGLQADRVVLLATPTHYGGYVRAMARQARLEGDTVAHLLNRLQEVIGVHPDRIDMRRQATSMRQPALFIHASDDKVVSHEGAQAAAASWPGAQWLLLEGLGHYKMLLEDPRVVRRVLEFASHTT
jgi:pimeloyl-ACP methyl ester carboxylesterase